MTRSTVLAPVSLLALLVASPAAAQADKDWWFEIGSGTDNRSKDASKSGNDGYVFGSATWESADGLFYVGPGVQTIQAGGSNLEAELVAGYRPEAWGYQFDFKVAYKNRLDADPGYDAETWELTGDISRAIGPAKVRLRVQHAPSAAGSTDAYTWVEGRFAWALSRDWKASAALGRREQDDGPDYTGWNAGVTWAVTDAVDLDLRYHDTDAHSFGEQYEDALVAKASYAF